MTHKLKALLDPDGVLDGVVNGEHWLLQCERLARRLHVAPGMLAPLPQGCLSTLNAWLDAGPVAGQAVLQRYLLRLRQDLSLEALLVVLTQLERVCRQVLWQKGLSGPDWVALSECLAEFFEALANTAIDGCQSLLVEYGQLKEELRALRRLSATSELATAPGQQWQEAVRETARLLQCEFCALLMPDPADPEVLTIQAVVAPRILGPALAGMAFPLSENGLIAQVYMTGAPASTYQVIEDLEVTIRRRQTLEGLGFSQLVAYPLQYRGGVLGVLCLANRLDDRSWQGDEQDWVSTVATQLAVAIRLSQVEGQAGGTVDELVDGLLAIQNSRDPARYRAAEVVADLARRVGVALGLDGARLDTLHLAARLHDWGESLLPDAIRHRPGPYWPEDWVVVRQHVDLGADLIGGFETLRPLVPGIRHHHERWDGLGYPAGLGGEQIPLEARIIAVVDAYVAMTEPRTYREQYDHAAALSAIVAEAGTQFDPMVVRAFHGMFDEANARVQHMTETGCHAASRIWTLEAHAPRLLELVQALRVADDARGFYDTVWRVLGSHCELAGGTLWRTDGEQSLNCVDVFGWLPAPENTPDGELEALAACARVAIAAHDLRHDERLHARDWIEAADFGMAIALPLLVGVRLVGVLTVYRRAGQTFSADDQAVLELTAALVASVFDRIQPGHSDSRQGIGSGLLGARHFAQKVHEATAAMVAVGQSCGLILVDIKGFDACNARLGFEWGDAVLARLARAIRDWLPPGAEASWLGADDFAIVLPNATAGEVMAHATRLRQLLVMRDDVQDHHDREELPLCFGVTSQTGGACVASALWQDARQALQRAKADPQEPFVYLAHAHP